MKEKINTSQVLGKDCDAAFYLFSRCHFTDGSNTK